MASRTTDRLTISLIDVAGANATTSVREILFGAGAKLYGPTGNGTFRL